MEKSPRAELADKLAAIICEMRMTAPFGGDVEKSGEGRKAYYGILFAKPRTLDGLVRVYSPKFIIIECQGPAAPGYGWSAIYKAEEAGAFLRAVAAGDREAAMAVPHAPVIRPRMPR